ncbi:glycosyl hydrolase 115 family protein [Pontiella sulfatireligans]|uniref:Alpha glucuronidase N-terminal domain-containing protein n=1 Tax=Pontiella sulfatireligans TaxID=2750658 RepID=A0A6C2UJK5_9BACT|nr:glycosyl hydrolase 115 family protein [Pontiella sulfatireligans]VGO20405.1 hypothetical protein SCARR_02468 [Pontiella sulfatireligans]
MKRIRFLHMILALFVGASAAIAQSATINSLVLTADTPWVVHDSRPKSIEAALDDIQNDWYKVFGRPPNILNSLPEEYKGPAIYFGNFPDSVISNVDRSALTGDESFLVRRHIDDKGRDGIVATANDDRGIIYAMYTFAEKVLGVDPWYYWTDHEPERRSSISVPNAFDVSSGPPTFTYRGWFINDEDLLNLFARDPVQENVFSLEMFDRVYETILRLKGNMVVPATFPFPDERCYELAARRGLVLNMHHILVLGLNTYRWPSQDAVFSYIQNKELMEQHWQTCIDAFKDYEVIWTVGYRGMHDRAFWNWETGVDTDEKRAAVINGAIARQVEMVRAKHPDAKFIANMWSEGAKLYHDGYIKLPEGVTLVWPDNGVGKIRDRGTVQAGQGIYYHTAMMNRRANQLTELINPALIYSELGRFVKAGATSFLLNNVSDIRPVPLSTDAFMKMGWNAESYIDDTPKVNEKEFMLDWCQRQYGEELAPELAELYHRYFYIPFTQSNPGYKHGKSVLHLRIREMDDVFAGLVLDDKPVPEELVKMAHVNYNYGAKSVPYVESLLKDVEAMVSRIPENRRDFFRGHLLTQTKLHLYSLYAEQNYSQAVLKYAEEDKATSIQHVEASIQAYEDLFSTLGDAEYGKWAGWYRGEAFNKIFHNYDRVCVVHARLTGQPEPLIRNVRDYEEIEQFQDRFSENFPLLYPKAK